MTDTSAQIEAGAAAIRAALDLLDKPLELYRRAPDSARIRLNQTFFGGFYVDDAGDLTGTLNPPFDDLHDAARAFRVVQGGKETGRALMLGWSAGRPGTPGLLGRPCRAGTVTWH
jgi:hypothetical protein